MLLTIGTQSLAGDFAFEQSTVGGNKRVRVSAANVSAIARRWRESFSPSRTAREFRHPQWHWFFGSLSGSVALRLPGVTAHRHAGRKVNTITTPDSGSNVSEAFSINGASTTLTLPAGNYIRVDGTALNLTVTPVGTTQTLTGDFIFEQLTTTSGARR